MTGKLDKAWNHAIENKGDDEHRKEQRAQCTLEFGIRLLLEVIDQHNGRDAEEVQEVHTDGKADDIGQQNDVAVAFDACTSALPLENEPEYQGRHERREGIHLSLYCREPEGVGPRVNQGTHHTRKENGDGLAPGHVVFGLVVAADNLLGERSNSPEEEKDCTCREQR